MRIPKRPSVSPRLLEILWIQALKPYGVLPAITPDRVEEIRTVILSWAELEHE